MMSLLDPYQSQQKQRRLGVAQNQKLCLIQELRLQCWAIWCRAWPCPHRSLPCCLLCPWHPGLELSHKSVLNVQLQSPSQTLGLIPWGSQTVQVLRRKLWLWLLFTSWNLGINPRIAVLKNSLPEPCWHISSHPSIGPVSPTLLLVSHRPKASISSLQKTCCCSWC